MFAIKRKIRLSETDATGCIYFINQLRFASEALEAFLEERLGELRSIFQEFQLPVVNVQSQYFSPLFWGDEIEIILTIKSIGNTSIEFQTLINKDGKKAGECFITHVFVSKKTNQSIEIPANLKLKLQ